MITANGVTALRQHLSKRIRMAAFLSFTIVALAEGCDHPSSTPKGATAASNDVSNALIGEQITIHGKFSLSCKVGACIGLDNRQVVYLVSKGSFTGGKPYSEMDGKPVAATGTLRFYHEPPAEPAKRAVQHAPDFFYFEMETVQLRLIGR